MSELDQTLEYSDVVYSEVSVTAPDYKTALIIKPGHMILFTKPMPNRWHRFWYRVLLGWKWERYER